MTAASTAHRFEVWEDNGFSFMARIIGNDATNVTQASISTIAYSVFDLAFTSTATATGTLVVADVIFDTLQTDARWTVDTTGYNFRWDVPVTICPDPDKTYRAEILFTPSTGNAFHVVFEAQTLQIYRS